MLGMGSSTRRLLDTLRVAPGDPLIVLTFERAEMIDRSLAASTAETSTIWETRGKKGGERRLDFGRIPVAGGSPILRQVWPAGTVPDRQTAGAIRR